MSGSELIDAALPTLADAYESGNRLLVLITPTSPREFEPLRQVLAALCAEGLLTEVEEAGYRLTGKGYVKFARRVAALRALPR